MRCETCNTVFPEDVLRCPNCQTRPNLGRLTFSKGKASLDRAVSESLMRAKSTSLLQKADTLDNFSESIERQNFNALTMADFKSAISHVEKQNTTSLTDLENLLALGDDQVMVEGIKLAELLDGKSDDGEILKKGLIFLKHRHYAEAIEWWSLNRQRLDTARLRLHFLLLIMEAFTYSLSGDLAKMKLIRERIKTHVLYDKYSE